MILKVYAIAFYPVVHNSKQCCNLLPTKTLITTLFRGLWRRQPELDIVRIQDVGLSGADDPTVLE
ncbi:hypothetical protein WKK05_04370 [Nostoc sp. UHCC 0302]|uniref:hypothetical protein n=1 Tax=Nostoc sp. UHCC 0302 TaxID=3134896 RepID=UPI00311CBB91